MMLKLLLSLFIFFSLCVEASASSKVDVKIEAGMYIPTSGGTVSNTPNTLRKADFENDFGYTDLQASHFSLIFLIDYDYVPNVNISYFNMKDNQDTTLDRTLRVADGDFNSSVSTTIDYSIMNFVFYQDFKQKGKYLSILGKRYYSGDFEFDIGVNAKVIDWKFNVQDAEDRTKSPSWITVNEYIPLPYLGFKYYLYDLTLYTDVSALAISKAKATSYQVGLDYIVIDSLYLSVGYLYEQFKAVEKLDTVEFETSGYKFGFKYIF